MTVSRDRAGGSVVGCALGSPFISVDRNFVSIDVCCGLFWLSGNTQTMANQCLWIQFVAKSSVTSVGVPSLSSIDVHFSDIEVIGHDPSIFGHDHGI